MCSHFLRSAWLVLWLPLYAAPAVLRVCADPNNLPFSNRKLEGFENRIATIIADDIGAKLQYYWWPQRRGFVRNTLSAGNCDVIIGLPAGLERVETTRPYYRSSYVFLTRRDMGLDITSFDDPRLRKLKIGVQLVGDDYTNTPPAHALSRRGIIRNVSGYRVAGDYSIDSPPSLIVQAVTNKDVDVAIVWGPLAGYYAQQARVPLRVAPVSRQTDGLSLPLAFDICMGVGRENLQLKKRLESALDRRREEIGRVLRSYGVPVIARATVVAGVK